MHIKGAHDDPLLNRTRGIAERVPMRRKIKTSIPVLVQVDVMVKDGSFLGEEQQATSKRLFKLNYAACLFKAHYWAANTSSSFNVIKLSSESFRCRREVYPCMPWHQTKAG